RALLAGGVRLLRPARADLLRAPARRAVALARGAGRGAPLGDVRRHGARVRDAGGEPRQAEPGRGGARRSDPAGGVPHHAPPPRHVDRPLRRAPSAAQRQHGRRRLLRRLRRLRAGRRLAPGPAQARARRAWLPRLLRSDAVPALHRARHAARSPRAVAGGGGRGHRRGRRRPLLPPRVVRRVRMIVPTPLIVLAGLLLVALILRLLVPSGVFTFSVGGTVGGPGWGSASCSASRRARACSSWSTTPTGWAGWRRPSRPRPSCARPRCSRSAARAFAGSSSRSRAPPPSRS